jgi:hypothetical protein
MPKVRTIVAGIALAVAGVLLIIATHWGHFRPGRGASGPRRCPLYFSKKLRASGLTTL